MAFTISSDDYFTWVNEELDKIIQKGGGSSHTPSRRTRSILSRMVDAGFTQRIIDRYSLLTDKMLFDYNENEHVVGLIQNYARRFPYSETIDATLRSFGLRAEKARAMRRLFEPLEGESYTHIQIIDMAIEQLFGVGVRTIGEKKSRHYIQPEKNDIWFLHKESGKQVYNFSGRCIPEHTRSLYEAIHRLHPPSDDYEFYYHTTNWEGGVSLLEGINHNAGRTCLDFGLTPSFYVGPKLKDAVELGVKRSLLTENENALLVFRIPKHIPSELHYKELVGDEWIVITKKSRICVPKIYNELRELRGIDLIYGEMVYNKESVKKSFKNPIPHDPPKFQLASKTDKGDTFLYDHMVGAIFFQKWMGR
jgi:hypothetical protein